MASSLSCPSGCGTDNPPECQKGASGSSEDLRLPPIRPVRGKQGQLPWVAQRWVSPARHSTVHFFVPFSYASISNTLHDTLPRAALSQLHTHIHAHAHTSCASHHPSVSFLIRPFPSTLAARQLFYRSSAVLCWLLKASHRETTPCESSLFLTTPPILSPSRASHPSHPEWRSWVCLSSPRPARPFQNPLTNSLTHSLT